jgi:outer membrane protein TolC
VGDLLDGDFRVWSLVGNLVQPLFQGGRLRAGVDRADATSREALAGYVGSVLGAFAEVESTLSAERHLAEQELHLADAAAQLVAARRLAEERYRSGVGIYLVVLESQTRALTAESELLAVRRQRLDNRVDLHLALGGGFGGDTTGDREAKGGESS